jgi:hypothetical protein
VIVIDYNPEEKVPPICESDVSNKAIVAIIDSENNYRYLGICRKDRVLASGNKVVLSGYCQNISIQRSSDGLSDWYIEKNLLSIITSCYERLVRGFPDITFLVLETDYEIDSFIKQYQIINANFLSILNQKKRGGRDERLYRISRSR